MTKPKMKARRSARALSVMWPELQIRAFVKRLFR